MKWGKNICPNSKNYMTKEKLFAMYSIEYMPSSFEYYDYSDNVDVLVGSYAKALIAMEDGNKAIPIVSGSFTIVNSIGTVKRDVLSNRGTQKLGFYLKERYCEADFIGYLKAGSKSLDLFNYLNLTVQRSDEKFSLTLQIGKEKNITIIFNSASITLPEVQLDDIISSKISVRSKELEIINDDIGITYNYGE
jgi:hypothetical protein